jgi:hypothetical protein
MNNSENPQLHKHSVMPSTCFRFFVRKNYPSVEISNEDLDELCIEFNNYLDALNLAPELIKKISPKNEMEVVMNMDNPLKQNGFHPAIKLNTND